MVAGVLTGLYSLQPKVVYAGKPKLSLTSRFMTSQLINDGDLLDAGTFAETANIRADACGAAHIFTDPQVADFKAKGGTDWQDQIMQTAMVRNTSLIIREEATGLPILFQVITSIRMVLL